MKQIDVLRIYDANNPQDVFDASLYFGERTLYACAGNHPVRILLAPDKNGYGMNYIAKKHMRAFELDGSFYASCAEVSIRDV